MTPPGEFTFSAERHDDTVVIVLQGELDLATAPEVERIADDALATRCSQLVLDLRKLTFLDSSGMRAFLRIQAKLRRRRPGADPRPAGRAARVRAGRPDRRAALPRSAVI